MKLPDLWTGLAIFALGIFAIVKAQGFPDVAGGASPRLFPQIIGGILILLGGLVSARSVARSGIGTGWERPDWVGDRFKIARILYAPVAIIVFAALARDLGTIPVSALLIIGYSLLWRTGLLAACIFGSVFSVVIYLFFTTVMRVPLPVGPVPLPF